MKTGDLVTYKQRPDLQQFPCPWSRMGLVTSHAAVQQDSGKILERWKVYWYDSRHECWYPEKDLELAR